MVVLVLSQNKVLQRFVEQILDEVVDRAQQSFEEQDLEVPRVSLVQSGVGLMAPLSDVDNLLALSHGNLDIISASSSSGRYSPSVCDSLRRLLAEFLVFFPREGSRILRSTLRSTFSTSPVHLAVTCPGLVSGGFWKNFKNFPREGELAS